MSSTELDEQRAPASPENGDPMSAEHRPAQPVTEPPHVGPLQAVASHPLLAVIPVLICVGIAALYGLSRTPKYSATTQMRVSQLNLSIPGAMSGFSTASSALATTFSLGIDADGVILPVAHRLGLSPTTVRDAVSGTPVPSSPLFTLKAISTSAHLAQAIVNQVSLSLVHYTAAQNHSASRADSIFNQFNRQAAAVSRSELAVAQAQRAFGAHQTAGAAAALNAARTALQDAQLKLFSLRTSYMAAVNDRAPLPQAQLLQIATSANNDRRKKLLIFIFIGALAGVLIGLGLATLRTRSLLAHRAGAAA